MRIFWQSYIFLSEKILRRLSSDKGFFSSILKFFSYFRKQNTKPLTEIRNNSGELTTVDKYWDNHTVLAFSHYTKLQSKLLLKYRRASYPLFSEMMDLRNQHKDETILDYGCGPGNDLAEFLLNSKAKKIIGIDISGKSLQLAQKRIALYQNNKIPIELIHCSDSNNIIPLSDNSIDYINCCGVLMHTSEPLKILNEFYRILKSKGEIRLMIYNRNSIWYHLYVPYVLKIIKNINPELSDEDAFMKSTDGEDCPLARSFGDNEFINLIKPIGFDANYIGGYLSLHELKIMNKYYNNSLNDIRLDESHKIFLKSLTFDKRGMPMFMGKYAGIGGVYKIVKN